MNRSRGKDWEAHLQVLSDSRWLRHCSMTDEEISNVFVKGNVISAACLAALAPRAASTHWTWISQGRSTSLCLLPQGCTHWHGHSPQGKDAPVWGQMMPLQHKIYLVLPAYKHTFSKVVLFPLPFITQNITN